VSSSSSLRFGVVLASSVVTAWQRRALVTLFAEPSVEFALAVLARSTPPRRRGLVFRGYEALDRRLLGAPESPLDPVELGAWFAASERIDAELVAAAGGHDFAPATVEAALARELDVLLQVGGSRLVGRALGLSRRGLWCFEHEEEERAGLPALFQPMARRDPVTHVRLLERSLRGTETLLTTVSSTNPYSLERNRTGPLWKASDLPARAARALADGREPPFDGGVAIAEAAASTSSRAPRAMDVARLAGSGALRVAANRRRLRTEDRVWFIALRERGETSIATDLLGGFAAVPCPPDRFHADPILVHDGERHHLFFEDADRATGHGSLAWCAIDERGRPGPIERILEMETHLSYPSVFRWQDEWFLIPETSERRTIELHRAIEFPLRWRLEKVLFHDVAAVDATPFLHDGRLWLFVAMSTSGASLNDELYLFHADSPDGAFTPHPMNPIVSDVRRARPAGPLFFEGATLYRPGQDCAGDYGAAFWIHRVDELTERSYRETPVRRVDPSWWPGGVCTHTYTRAGRFEAMDNRVWVRRDRSE
jgi:hypothetical protein